MQIIEWNDSLSVGIDAMDTQHKKLIKLVSTLLDAMREGKGKQVLNEVLSELVSYTKIHFSAEEKLMKDHNYPALDDHKEQHQNLIVKVSDFCNKFNAGEIGLTIPLCNFLQNWLKDHISGEDKKYGQYINSQAVAAR